MDGYTNFKLLFSLPFALGGTLFLIIAYREWHSNYQIIQNGVKTEGIVIGTHQRPKRIGERTTSGEAPVVQFVTLSGQPQTYYSTFYTTPCGYQSGDRIPIWYLAQQPERATIDGKDAWVLPIVFGIFGIAICLIFYPILLRSLWAWWRA